MIWSRNLYEPQSVNISNREPWRARRPITATEAKLKLCAHRIILSRDIYAQSASSASSTSLTGSASSGSSICPRPTGSLSSASTAASEFEASDAPASRVLFLLEACRILSLNFADDDSLDAAIDLQAGDAQALKRYLAARVTYGGVSDECHIPNAQDALRVYINLLHNSHNEEEDGGLDCVPSLPPFNIFVRKRGSGGDCGLHWNQWKETLSHHMRPAIADQPSLIEFFASNASDEEEEVLDFSLITDVAQCRSIIMEYLRLGTIADALLQVLPSNDLYEAGTASLVLVALRIRHYEDDIQFWKPPPPVDFTYPFDGRMIRQTDLLAPNDYSSAQLHAPPYQPSLPLLGPSGFTPRGLNCSCCEGVQVEPFWPNDASEWITYPPAPNSPPYTSSPFLNPNADSLQRSVHEHPRRSPIIAFSVGSQLYQHPDILCCFWDLESTGLNVRSDHIIQIGCTARVFRRTAVASDGEFTLLAGLTEQEHDFSVFLKTDLMIPPEVSAMTKITNELLDMQGVQLEEALDAWRSWVMDLRDRLSRGSNVPELWMIAHNGNQFDLPLLFHHELTRLRWTPGTFLKEMDVSAIVDSVVLSRALYFADFADAHVISRSHRLSDLYRDSFHTDMPNQHNALYDAKAIASVMASEPFLSAWRYLLIAWRLSDYLQAFTRAFGRCKLYHLPAELLINRFLSESVTNGTYRSRMDYGPSPTIPHTLTAPHPFDKETQLPSAQQTSSAKSLWQSFSAKARRSAARRGAS